MRSVNEWNGTQTPSSQNIPPPINPPHLMRLVRVKVLRPFCVKGKPLASGDEVEVEFHLAKDLQALGKAAIVAGSEA